jgi:hypothetical protein
MNSYFNRDSIGNPSANGIVTAGQMPCVMGMQTFDSDSRTSHTARRTRPNMVTRNIRITFCLVQAMGIFKFCWINVGFSLVDSAGGLKTTDGNQSFG